MSIILPYDEEPATAIRGIEQTSANFQSDNVSILSKFEYKSIEDVPQIKYVKSVSYSDISVRKIEKGEVYIPIPELPTPLSVYQRKCDQFYSAPLQLFSETIEEHKKKFDPVGYGIEEVNIYYLFEALIGPPLVNLTRLFLDNNPFGKNPCVTLAHYLESSTVKCLSLNNCQIGAEGIAVLAESIERSRTIEYLNLSRCDLRDNGGVIIAKSMCSNRSIINLDLSFNKMWTNAAKEIGSMCSINNRIQILNLKWNDFYPDEASKIISEGLVKNKSIRNLNLSFCGLIGVKFAKEFSNYLKRTRLLRILSMECNCLSDEELALIITGLQKCIALKECYMGGNRWTNKSIAFFLVGQYPSLDIFSFGDRGLESNLYELAKIFMMQPNKKIIFGGKIKPNPPDPINFNNVIFDRMKLVAMKPKKKKFQRDMGHFMWWLLEESDDLFPENVYDDLYAEFNAKLDAHLAKQLKELYLIKIGKVKRIDGKSMAKDYLSRHPTKKPPPKKQPEPPPPPPPPVEPKGKKKK